MKKISIILFVIISLFLTSCNNQVEKQNKESIPTGAGNTIEANVDNKEVKVFDINTIGNEKINVVLITDSKAEELKNYDGLFDRVKNEKFLKGANFITLDYSNKEDKKKIDEILKEYNVNRLPIVMLNTNELKDNGAMSDFLIPIKDKYFLTVGARYNPITGKVENEKGLIEKEFDKISKKIENK